MSRTSRLRARLAALLLLGGGFHRDVWLEGEGGHGLALVGNHVTLALH